MDPMSAAAGDAALSGSITHQRQQGLLLNRTRELTRNIAKPHRHDVISGKGGRTNSHPGNRQWRSLVGATSEQYRSIKQHRVKDFFADSIVKAIHNQHPPGRFLERDETTGLWKEMPDDAARQKTKQRLRETKRSAQQQQQQQQLQNALNLQQQASLHESFNGSYSTPTAASSANRQQQQQKLHYPQFLGKDSTSGVIAVPPFFVHSNTGVSSLSTPASRMNTLDSKQLSAVLPPLATSSFARATSLSKKKKEDPSTLDFPPPPRVVSTSLQRATSKSSHATMNSNSDALQPPDGLETKESTMSQLSLFSSISLHASPRVVQRATGSVTKEGAMSLSGQTAKPPAGIEAQESMMSQQSVLSSLSLTFFPVEPGNSMGSVFSTTLPPSFLPNDDEEEKCGDENDDDYDNTMPPVLSTSALNQRKSRRSLLDEGDDDGDHEFHQQRNLQLFMSAHTAAGAHL